jgi:hypothetical protein
MELQKAIDILMHLHRHKLGKDTQPTYSPTEINTARNTLIQYNTTQRSLTSEPTPHHTRVHQ